MEKRFLQNITILYVEDEENVRELTTSFLKRFTKKLYVATNGTEGLEIFKNHYKDKNKDTIDMIITDIHMPGMNGLEMLEKIGQIDDLVPSILTTAYNDSHFLEKAINQRVRGYVSKPLDMNHLIDTILIVSEPKYLKDKLEKLNMKLEKKVEVKTQELKAILDAQDNLILVLNGADNSFDVNQTLLDFFGYESAKDFFEDHTCLSDLFLAQKNYFTTKNCKTWPLEIMKREDKNRVVVMKRYDNKEMIFRVNVKSFEFNTKHMVISFTDITDLKNYTYTLQHQATHDTLTNLFNRQKLSDELLKEIARENRYNHGLSLVMLDIDNFKSINDTYGHDVGDIVLKDISKIIRNSIRITDFPARWGGEEFMILLPETRLNQSYKIAEEIRKNIEKYKNKVVPHAITMSIGTAQFKRNLDDLESWIKNVDIAMYQAKKTGKNRVVKYEK